MPWGFINGHLREEEEGEEAEEREEEGEEQREEVDLPAPLAGDFEFA